MTATRTYEYSAFDPVLYLAFESSDANWKLGFTTGTGKRPRQRNLKARELGALLEEIARVRTWDGVLQLAEVQQSQGSEFAVRAGSNAASEWG